MISREMEPLLWLAGLLLLCGLHLMYHPQSRYFRLGLAWVRKNPAPMLFLAASYTVLGGLGLWPGDMIGATEAMSSRVPKYTLWLASVEDGLHRFVLSFHHAIAPLPVLINPWVGALLQAMITAGSQIWFCRLLINSQSPFTEDWISFRQTLALWPSVLLLSALYFPWWFLQKPGAAFASPLLTRLILQEFLLLLAPLPLMLAFCQGQFKRATALCLRVLLQHRFALFTIAAGAVLMFAFLDYSILASHRAFDGGLAPLRVISSSLLGSALHVWLYVTVSLVMLSKLQSAASSE